MTGKLFFLISATAFVLCFARTGWTGESIAVERAEAKRQMDLGNYRVAGDIYRRLVLDAGNTPRDAVEDMTNAIANLNNLDEGTESEKLLREAETAWKDSWRVLAALASLQTRLPAMVRLVDGEYVRANYWGHDSRNASARDRVVAIRLMLRAEKLLDAATDPATEADKAAFYRQFAELTMLGRESAGWRLSALTDVAELPDYQTMDEFYGSNDLGAPVDADGNPLLYGVPESWDAAQNDGERWRWLLSRLATHDDGKYAAEWELAAFLHSQFGVHTMGQNFPVANPSDAEAGTGAFAVRTLSEDETIARLATGVKRFALPEGYNFIAMFTKLAGENSGEYRDMANVRLGQIFENRQQYTKALDHWRKIAAEAKGDSADQAKRAVDRITGNNGRLESGPVAPAGKRTSIPYLYRNGASVTLTAHRLNEKRLLDDIRRAMKDSFFEGDYYTYRPETIGRMVVERDMVKYLGDKAAEWQVTLQPPAGHYSTRAQLEMPFTEAGCYLVEAKMADGNTSRVVLWIADLSVMTKMAGGYNITYVADALTGAPVAGATVSYFGFNARYVQENNRRQFETKEFAETADANGLVVQDSERFRGMQWLTAVTTEDGRAAYLGFDSIWPQPLRDSTRFSESSFIITDRPVYRPDQTVNFKIWIGKPSYTPTPEDANLSGRSLAVKVWNPMGEVVYEKTLVTGAYGDAADSLVLDANAPLGGYRIAVDNVRGSVSFRLEEYKKPEYEVTVETPDKALVLGAKADIVVKAAYYYSAPVTDARVKYKVMRSPFDNVWFPPWRWDWLYGSGRWWPCYAYTWLPGWDDWGVLPPLPPWFPRPYSQPELVAEGEAKLDADGVFRLPLDTAAAKELYGHQDHEYTISVEVMDQSRRTIVGEGKVVASRKPFAVTVWADRGFYQTGREANVRFMARLPRGGGVKATGKAVLYRVNYDDKGTPAETEVQSWDIATDASGAGDLTLATDRPGQYRLSCILTDGDDNAVPGAAVLTVRGTAGDGDFRFAALELVSDNREYKPGDTVRLAINSENKSAFVLFLPRAERNGNADPARLNDAPKPELLKLENGTRIVELSVGRSDYPNFFCEAVTIFDGKIHVETREIFVPPVDKTLTVTVAGDKEQYLPGEKAVFSVNVADADGNPVAGQCVVSVYDRSVEYISGGSNVGDIRAHFWQWKRGFQPRYSASLQKYGYRVMKQGDVEWEPLGIFGAKEADWNDDMVYLNGAMPRQQMATMRMRKAEGPAYSMAEAAPMEAMLSAPVPAAPAAGFMDAKQDAGAGFAEADTGGDGAMREPAVRSAFADTALWVAALTTDPDGRATFEVTMPENLTAWKARTWIMAAETRVGDGETVVETRKNVIVRPQTPRFLTQKDQVVLSANLHNYLASAKSARAVLELEGGVLEAADNVELTKTVELAANGEARVDWLVNARRPGTARVVMKLLTDEESDAAAITFPVVVHGARRVESFGGVIRGDETETTVTVRVPEERLADQSRLELSFSPSIASAMLEALPFLIEYPYGCTEQTLNRFLPVVMTRSYLSRLGVDLSTAKKAVDNAPTDAKSDEWKGRFGDPRSKYRASPVFDDAALAAMVKQGVERLATMQNPDGGWGWFSGPGENSWPHTTAVVVHGLLAARDNGVAVPPNVVDQGLEWLKRYRERQIAELKEHEATGGKKGKAKAGNLDAFVHMILCGGDLKNAEMRDYLYRDRLELSLSGLAMLGIALHGEEDRERLDIVLQNLEQFLEENTEIGTARLKTPARGWWWWYNDAVETQTWYLKLLTLTDPKGARAGGVAKHLLRNRKNGSYWNSTRDTAYAIEALSAYAVASGETDPDMTVAVYLDDKKVMERKLTRANILDENRFLLEGVAVEAGDHELRIVRTGGGNLYYAGALDVFSLEDPIARAGLELKVQRAYYKLVPEEKTADMRTASGVAAPGRVEKYRRERLATPFDADPAATVRLEPGDLIEVELSIEAANDYEYLVFEDMKAAGCEAVELRSGYSANSLGAYVEYRDQKVVLFVRHLPQGKYTMSYRLRAEIPGWFSALPTFAGGMYATDLFANSDEMKVRISEEGVFE